MLDLNEDQIAKINDVGDFHVGDENAQLSEAIKLRSVVVAGVVVLVAIDNENVVHVRIFICDAQDLIGSSTSKTVVGKDALCVAIQLIMVGEADVVESEMLISVHFSKMVLVALGTTNVDRVPNEKDANVVLADYGEEVRVKVMLLSEILVQEDDD